METNWQWKLTRQPMFTVSCNGGIVGLDESRMAYIVAEEIWSEFYRVLHSDLDHFINDDPEPEYFYRNLYEKLEIFEREYQQNLAALERKRVEKLLDGL